MRRYDDSVDVRVEEGAPTAFLWRGRLYAVREVLGSWREREAWWGRRERLADAGERQVWRVEAGRGRVAGTGVYDLAHPQPGPRPGQADGPGEGWTLLRAVD